MAIASKLNNNVPQDQAFEAIRRRAAKVLQKKPKHTRFVDYSDPNWWASLKAAQEFQRAAIKEKWPWASTRIVNAFMHLGLETDECVKDAWLRGDLKRIPNIGKKSLKEIQEAMGFNDAHKTCPCCGQTVKD